MKQSVTSLESQSLLEFGQPEASLQGPGRVAPLSVIVLTYNEEINLPGCLASLNGLDCRIWVVDSGSTDNTVALARAHGAQTVSHPFENYATQRNWSLKHLPLDTQWILNLDADERLTPELVAEINRTVQNQHPNSDAPDGYLIRKRTVFMGRWIRHGGHYPSYHLRLFRNGRGRCEERLYDQHFLVDGSLGKLKHDYIDVIASNISSWSVRHVRWAGLEAQQMAATETADQVKPDLFGNPIQQRRWLRSAYGSGPLFLRALLYWFYRYFLKLGILDGVEGLVFHFLQGFWFRFLIDAIIVERRRSVDPSRPTV